MAKRASSGSTGKNGRKSSTVDPSPQGLLFDMTEENVSPVVRTDPIPEESTGTTVLGDGAAGVVASEPAAAPLPVESNESAQEDAVSRERLLTAFRPEREFPSFWTPSTSLSVCLRSVWLRGPVSENGDRDDADTPSREAFLYRFLVPLHLLGQQCIEDSIAAMLRGWRGAVKPEGRFRKGRMWDRKELIDFALGRFDILRVRSGDNAVRFHETPQATFRLMEHELALTTHYDEIAQIRGSVEVALTNFYDHIFREHIFNPIAGQPDTRIIELPRDRDVQLAGEREPLYQHRLKIRSDIAGKVESVNFEIPYDMHLLFIDSKKRHRLLRWQMGNVPGSSWRGKIPKTRKLEAMKREELEYEQLRVDKLHRAKVEIGSLLLAAKQVHGLEPDRVMATAVYLSQRGVNTADRMMLVDSGEAVRAAEDEMARHFKRFELINGRLVPVRRNFPQTEDPAICRGCVFQTCCPKNPLSLLVKS